VRTGFVSAIDGTRLYYTVRGQGPVVVLCDGILCEGFVWKYLEPFLAESFQVVHWNYRGHGRSGPPRDSSRIGIADHARDLWSVLDALAVSAASVVGHSMGTQVCLEAYRLDPSRVQSMTLACGSYGRITRTFHDTDVLARWLPTVLAFATKHPRLVRALVSRTPAHMAVRIARLGGEIDPLRASTQDMLPYFEHLTVMDPELYLRMLDAAGMHSAEDLLGTITAPTLVVAAERDTFTPPRLAEQMARQIPGSRFYRVRDGSHACLIEQPGVINAEIAAFLREWLARDTAGTTLSLGTTADREAADR